MPDVPSLKAREVISRLAAFGFAIERQTGSHCILKKPGHKWLVTVPVHAGKDVKKGTLRGIIQDAGLTIEEFIKAG